MGQELERKFLLSGAQLPVGFNASPYFIKQGYIFVEKDKHLRIRITWDPNYFVDARLGLKFTKTVARKEYEPKLDIKEATEIYDEQCKWTLEKKRIIPFEHELANYCLDTYPNGIQVVEVEFSTQKEFDDFVPPVWLGKEVSGVYEYSNITLAKQNLKF